MMTLAPAALREIEERVVHVRDDEDDHHHHHHQSHDHKQHRHHHHVYN